MSNEQIGSIKFNVNDIYQDKKVNTSSTKNIKLFEHIQDNIEWVGGQKGEELTAEHVANFLTHIDGNGEENKQNGEITSKEIETWIKANGHGDKFGTVKDIMNALNEIVTPKEKQDNTVAAMAYDKASELNEVDNKLAQHLKENIEWIGGKEGDELTSAHLAEFLTHIDGKEGDGLITHQEVQSWLDKNGHGMKFGTVDDVFNMLKDLMKSESAVYKAKSYDDYAADVAQAVQDAQDTWFDDDIENDKISKLSMYDDGTKPQDVAQDYKAEVYKQTVNLFSANELKRMDSSGDGTVTKEEYVNYSGGDEVFGEWFDNIDTDKDGKLETAELSSTYSLQDWQNGFLEDIEKPNQYNGQVIFGQEPNFGDEKVVDALLEERKIFE
ncbi:MAG: hypothetical protein IJD57_04160 [Candidatus Gastranaerophilales bacterium]|nr:hypothetical protein [Candidatus Gastranaerophilales bacterium]